MTTFRVCKCDKTLAMASIEIRGDSRHGPLGRIRKCCIQSDERPPLVSTGPSPYRRWWSRRAIAVSQVARPSHPERPRVAGAARAVFGACPRRNGAGGATGSPEHSGRHSDADCRVLVRPTGSCTLVLYWSCMSRTATARCSCRLPAPGDGGLHTGAAPVHMVPSWASAAGSVSRCACRWLPDRTQRCGSAV